MRTPLEEPGCSEESVPAEDPSEPGLVVVGAATAGSEKVVDVDVESCDRVKLDANVLIGSRSTSAVVYKTGSGASNINSVTLQQVVFTWPDLCLIGGIPPRLQHQAFGSRHFQYTLPSVKLISPVATDSELSVHTVTTRVPYRTRRILERWVSAALKPVIVCRGALGSVPAQPVCEAVFAFLTA